MSHGSKSEEEIWTEFHDNWSELAFESERLLARFKGETIENSAKISLENLPKEGKIGGGTEDGTTLGELQTDGR